jgi:predicted PurR-regulated permease PerM
MPPRSLLPLFSGSSDVRSATLQNLLIAAIVITGLYVGRDVLLPLALAILLSFVLTPPLILLRKLKVPRVIGVAILVTGTFAAMAGLGWLMSQQVTELARALPTYQYTLSEKVAALRESTAQSAVLEQATKTLQRLQEELSDPKTDTEGAVPSPDGEEQKPEPVPVEIIGDEGGVLYVYREVFETLLPPLATIGIVFLFSIFILMQREDLRDRAIKLLGASDLQRTTSAMNDAAHRLSQYFLRQLLINSLYGVFIGFGLWLIGVPTPAVWGILAMLMRFVPYIGSYIAAFFPVLLAAAVDPGWTTVFLTLGLYLISEPIMGQVVEPLVYGHGTGLSPVAVIVTTVFWTWLWGPLGLLLAMPITVCLVVLGRHVEGLHFLEVMLGDEPALSPEQSFYQRALTGDAAEATYQAELCLKDQSLQTYLDNVAMEGLRFAERDAARGVLDGEQIARIGETVKEVVGNLAHFAPRRWFSSLRPAENGEAAESGSQEGLAHLLSLEEDSAENGLADVEIISRDTLPEDWRGKPVLCIGGRTPLDEAAAHMLAELLIKRGLGAEAEGPKAISAGNITSLQQTEAKILCLSYFGLEESPAHIRYLILRLRRILPENCTILVGCWACDETGGRALAELQAAAGADAYAITLGEAVDFCLEAAKAASGETPSTKPIPAANRAKPASTKVA